MKLTKEEVSAVVTNVRDNIRPRPDEGDEHSQMIKTVGADAGYTPLLVTSMLIAAEYDLDPIQQVQLHINSGLLIGYEIGKAEAKKQLELEELERIAK